MAVRSGHFVSTSPSSQGTPTRRPPTDIASVAAGRTRPRTAVRLHRVIKAEAINEELGLVFGWAIICKEDGQDYFDLNIDYEGEHAGERVPENITELAMLKGAFGFAVETDRPGNEMHVGPETGSFAFLWPLTTEIAKAMGLTCKRTGLMVAYHPEVAVLEKFKSGEYTGFSIEGFRGHSEEHG